MLALTNDDFSDTDRARLANCLTQQRVRFFAAFAGHEIVRRLKVARIDLLLLHKVENVDGLRLLDGSRLEILVGHHDESSFLVLVAFDDLIPGYGLAIGDADALVLDGREILLMQEAEADMIRANRSLQLDGDIHEADRQRAFPDCGHPDLPASGEEESMWMKANQMP